MKQNTKKISLDILMLFILVTLYNKRAVNLAFHEITGLAIAIIFVVHLLFNRKWITGVCKKLFSSGLKPKTRVSMIINLLLLIDFIIVIVTGILISKIVFKGGNGGITMLLMHFSAAGFSLILMGIHVGMHWNYIKNFFKKLSVFSKKPIQYLIIVILSAATIYGAYSVKTTSFSRWISMPFTINQSQDRGEQHGEEHATQKPSNGRGQGMGKGNGNGHGQPGMNGGMSFSMSNLLQTVTSFFSIIVLFAAITACFEKLLCKLTKKQ